MLFFLIIYCAHNKDTRITQLQELHVPFDNVSHTRHTIEHDRRIQS